MDLEKPLDLGGLRQKGVIITGGSSGLGEGFSIAFAEAGAYLVIADLNNDMGSSLEQDLKKKGLIAKFIQVDVASWDSQVAMFQTAFAWFSAKNTELHCVVTSAGVGGTVFDLEPSSPDMLSSETKEPCYGAIQVGLLGSLNTVQLAVKYGMSTPNAMNCEINQIDKSIILVGSMAGYTGIPQSSDYTASKYGIRGIFKSMRTELPKLGIRLNMLAPCYIKTPMTAAKVDKITSQGFRLGKIEDAVEGVLRFATDPTVNGRSLAVVADGLVDLEDDFPGKNAGECLKILKERHCLMAFTPAQIG